MIELEFYIVKKVVIVHRGKCSQIIKCISFVITM